MERESLVSAQDAMSRLPALKPSQEAFVFPLSYAQQRLWLLDRLLPRGSIYNIARGYRLCGRLDIGALRAALNELVRRHEVLRTRFGSEDRGPVQVIAAQMQLALEIEDLGTGVDEAREA